MPLRSLLPPVLRMPGSGEPRVRVSHSHALLLCALFFFLSHGAEAFSPSLNIDEWNKLGQTNVHFGRIGRWGAEIIYEDFFQGDFVPLIQFSAALVFLYLSAWVLTGANRPADTAGVFIVGVSHPFWVDLFNFSFVTASYALAMLLGLAGVRFAMRGSERSSTLAVLGAGILIGVGLSIYQTLALFGSVLIVLRLVDLRTIGAKRYASEAGRAAAAIGVGTLLYVLQNRAYFLVHTNLAMPDRVSVRSLRGMLETLPQLPGRAVDTLTALPLGDFATLFTPAIAALALIVVALTARALYARGHGPVTAAVLTILIITGAVGLSVIGTGLLVVAPLPFRARPESTFALAAVALASWRALADAPRPVGPREWRVWRETLTWAGVIVAFTGALTANQLWEFQHRVEDRDRALAQRIMNRHDALVAKHELNPARAMTVVGPKRHGDTPPTHLRSIGQSASGSNGPFADCSAASTTSGCASSGPTPRP